MREILFRGKTKSGNWVYGGYVGICNGGKIADLTVIHIIEKCDNELVKTVTVGQFTGLTDKNGKKIFEDDIIQGTITSAWSKSVIRCEVAYIKDGFYSIEHKRNKELVTHKLGFARDIEVIGNIHDNPELLKE